MSRAGFCKHEELASTPADEVDARSPPIDFRSEIRECVINVEKETAQVCFDIEQCFCVCNYLKTDRFGW